MLAILNLARAARRRLFGTPEGRFDDVGLKHATGVVHVGANAGQERDEYHRRRLPVIWVEPIPDVFDELQRNIAALPAQRAFRYLLSDQDGIEYDFHLASNRGASSSIFASTSELGDMYPDISFNETLRIRSARFDTMVQTERLELTSFDVLVLDVQGAELLVLKGTSLDSFRAIRCEVGNGLLYRGGAQLEDIDAHLNERGFVRRKLTVTERHKDGGFWGDAWYFRVRE